MKKRSILIILLLAALNTVFAQSISVKITDASGNPLPYASVAVRKSADSTLVKGQMSDADGKCLFEKIAAGSYYLEVSQMGFTTKKGNVFQVKEAAVDLKTIALEAAPKSLKGVEVTAQKPFIERSEGKTILNVESSVAAAGNTVLDLLRRAPGITVDKDENLVMKGKQGVTVMLDGKLTYLSAEALAELLKSMTAESVSQIEIITSPSAKYDAAGTAGIINIKTKKGQMTGTNGTLNLSGGGGRYMFFSTGLSLNWRTKKFNVFTNLNWADRQFFNTRLLHRKTPGDVPLHFQQDVFQKGHFLNRSGKAGIDWYITEKQTIGFMVNAYRNAFWRDAPSATQIARQSNMIVDSILYSSVAGNNRFNSTSYNLNYKFKLDTSGSEFSMDADYMKFNNNMKTWMADSVKVMQDNSVHDQNAVRTLPYTDITIRSIKADFVKAVTKSSKIEAGVKGSFVTTQNNMRYDSLKNGVYQPVYEQYDEFLYDENVLAAYLIYKKQFKKTDFVVGLRLEQTISDATSNTLKSNVKRTYLDYFPNFTADHKFSDNHKLGITYNKRINRPGYGMLNPFMFFLDRYTFFRGNAYLTPEYIHNTELTYTFKNKYIATLGYSRVNDVYDEFLILVPETKVTISTNKNLGRQNSYSLNLTLPFDPVKWWNTSNNLSAYYNEYRILDSLGNFNTSQLSWNFNSTNTFTLPHDFKFELSGWYEAPNVYGIWVSKSMWSVNCGVQKTVLKKKGTIKVNVNDIFASQRFRGVAEFNNIYLSVNNRWQNRTLNVAFSYRFGNTKMETKERQSGTDESRRAGN
ncbi:outer membrane beta-barrel protein [Chitinophaga sp. YIM B06452]|uniref:outer membrane beta-barrel protein n=1 Tax=Chitinophaga sp. YIM B06452 TaxID=3082158 RepID=UPI0031FE8AE7